MKQGVDDREFTLLGAEVKVKELKAGIEDIYRRFPELRRRRSSGAADDTAGKVRRKRRPPTDAERRKISAGMRRLWARRRAEARGKRADRPVSA